MGSKNQRFHRVSGENGIPFLFQIYQRLVLGAASFTLTGVPGNAAFFRTSQCRRESMVRWCVYIPSDLGFFDIWIWVKLIQLSPSPNDIEIDCLLCTDLVLIGYWILATWPTVDQLFRRHACKKDVHEEMKFRTTRFNLTCIAFLHVTLQPLLKRKLEDSSFLIFCWSVSIPGFVAILFYSMYIFWFWKKQVQQPN